MPSATHFIAVPGVTTGAEGGFDDGMAGVAVGGITAAGVCACGEGWQAGSKVIVKTDNRRIAGNEPVFFMDLYIIHPYFTRDSALGQLIFLRKASM